MPNEFYINKRNGDWKGTSLMSEVYKTLPDGAYIATIKSTKIRTNPQNQYYWGVVVPKVYDALRDAGFDAVKTKDDAHEIMKALFLKVKEEKGGINIEKILSTTELTTIGFAQFLMNIFQWAAEYLGIAIPEPNEQLEFEL
jgi:hypothetical protein